MSRTKSRAIPIWKQLVAGTCGAYWILVWCIPIFMFPFVNILPFVHQLSFFQRLAISFSGSILTFVILFAMSPKRFLDNCRASGRSAREKTTHWLGMLLGFVLLTYSGAELSPNLFGALAKVFPARPYEEFVKVEAVAFSGSKYKSVKLTLRGIGSNQQMYLVLSKTLFEYPRFQVGDNLKLSGQQTLIGTYITGFRFSSPALEANTSFQGTPASGRP